MNGSQIHLALTHFPVILSLVGLVVLLIGMYLKNDVVIRTSFFLILAAGVIALPVFFTGEGAEHVIENLPGVSEVIIKEHESFALISFIIATIAGVFALGALVLFRKTAFHDITIVVVLVVAAASTLAMVQTAHLGGRIRHPEVHSDFVMQEKPPYEAPVIREKEEDD